MSQLKVWGHPRSINVQKVLWALDELGLTYERIDAGSTFGVVTEPAYLAKNPNGLIPVLEDGGEALWESNAILRYVFARYGKAPLHPDNPIGRARADAWTEWYGSTFWPNVRVQLVQLVRTPEGKRDAAVIEAAQAQTKGALGILEAHLAKQPFVTGREFTWGDIPLAAAAQRWFNLPIKRPSHPAVEAWYARIRERPAFKKWIDIPLT
jgi:glutathione S-transferase